mmetsp:Transcript_36596/g.117354  ORF Transcript_36596/g.117354 Transcript_36596/m.117354 type:complete len:414 (-) Transcript_36596:1276-2517(-)
MRFAYFTTPKAPDPSSRPKTRSWNLSSGSRAGRSATRSAAHRARASVASPADVDDSRATEAHASRYRATKVAGDDTASLFFVLLVEEDDAAAVKEDNTALVAQGADPVSVEGGGAPDSGRHPRMSAVKLPAPVRRPSRASSSAASCCPPPCIDDDGGGGVVTTRCAAAAALRASAAPQSAKDSASMASRRSRTRRVIRFTVGFQWGVPPRSNAGSTALTVALARFPPRRSATSGRRHMWSPRSQRRQFSDPTQRARRSTRRSTTFGSSRASSVKAKPPPACCCLRAQRRSSSCPRSKTSLDVDAVVVAGQASRTPRRARAPRPGSARSVACRQGPTSSRYVATRGIWSRHSAKSFGRSSGRRASRARLRSVVATESPLCCDGDGDGDDAEEASLCFFWCFSADGEAPSSLWSL